MKKTVKTKTEGEKNLYKEHEQAELNGGYRENAKEGFFGDIATKILAVIIAFVIWCYAMAVDSPASSRTFGAVPVNIINVTETGLTVMSGNGITVDVTVQGKKSEINKLTESDINAYADVGKIGAAGSYTLPISVKLPAGISLTAKSVGAITVYMDNTVTKNVPVTVAAKNYMIDKGYELGTPVPNISEVKIEGPGAVLDKIAAAQVSLELGHITNSVTVTDTLTLIDAAGKTVSNPYVTVGVTEVQVTVPVYITKDVPIEVDYKYGYFNGGNVKIIVSPVSIRIKGDPKIISSINRIVTTLDEKKVVSDIIKQEIVLPDGVINVSGVDTVTITIEHIGTATKDIVVDEFNVINPNNIGYELLDSFITVRVRGSTAYLPYISSSNITAAVDLTGFSKVSGTTSVPVTISITGMYKDSVYEIGEYKTTVNISP